MNGIRRRTWAQIDLDAAADNFAQIRGATSARVCCVIKANAYGHGAVVLARLYESLHADFLAVSNIEEALQLRRGAIRLPLLILGYTPPECAPLLCDNDISQCVYSAEYAEALSAAAVAAGKDVRVHVKLDTGMGRIGFTERQIADAERVCRLPGLSPEGVFTHFAVADEGDAGEAFTRLQFDRFQRMSERLTAAAGKKLLRHCANSAALFDYPEFALDMVRAGDVLYGLAPSDKMRHLPALKPVMTLNTVISHVKEIEAGDTVSYGRMYKADKQTKIATVPIGYADGFPRLAGGKYGMLLGDRLVPIAGRVCMDQTMLDVTGTDARVGDVVTVFGGTVSSADKLAEAAQTINYEIVCAVGERVPRFYVRGGTVVEVCDNLCE